MIFKPRARLLLQLGEQLIRNESIAVLELVKNAYDADASMVKIEMKNIDEPEKGIVIIEDDGIGMDMDIIQNVWLEPGTDYKEKLKVDNNKYKSKFNRIPLGEKGIGRFAVHKLGKKIEIISRKENSKEVYLFMDWNLINKTQYLEDVKIEVEQRVPEIFKGNMTGTKIVIRNLQTAWTKNMVRDLYRSLISICSPFDSPDSFKINFAIDKEEWLKGLLKLDDIQEYALFKVEVEMEGGEIKTFKYEFTPWTTMQKLSSRIITEKDKPVKDLIKMVDKDKNPIDLSKFKIGKVIFKAMIFDRDSRILSLGVQDKKGLKEYLDINGGVRVYRDGIRIYDYGEPGNDWLNLDIRRVNIPTVRISNNIIIGAIHLNSSDSQDLIEKTNREGFIENEAYDILRSAIIYTLGIIEMLRKEDKDKLRTLYGPSASSEPVISSISDLKDVVERKIKDVDLKKEINTYLTRIENDYKYINEVLLKSAGAGLSLSVVIHEIEKIIAELKKVVENETKSKRIIDLVRHLSQLTEGYGAIIRGKGTKIEDLKKIIDQALFNIEFRLQSHNITVIPEYKSFNKSSNVKCTRNLIIGSILNIIDNSIWWLDYARIQNKKIFINLSDEIREYLSIIIADNGPGFALPVEEITKPFVSAKPDGMGLGLHIVSEIMKAHKGKIIFPEPDDFSIPDEFKKGAIIVLAFKKEN